MKQPVIIEISGRFGAGGSVNKRRLRQAALAALEAVPPSHSQHRLLVSRDWSISIQFVTAAKMKALNYRYRRQNKPTDVLSFPLWKGEWAESPDGRSTLGDILICGSVATEQCKAFGNTPLQELERLVIHGTLHLLDYDHEASAAQAKIMFALEKKAVRKTRKK